MKNYKISSAIFFVLIIASFVMAGWGLFEKLFCQASNEQIMRKVAIGIAFGCLASLVRDFIMLFKNKGVVK